MDVTVGTLERADVGELAHLHREAFPGFFLSRLGEPFLIQFYSGFIGDGSAVTAVTRDGSGRPLGAVVGTTEPAGFFGRLVRRKLVGFALASLRAGVFHPSAPHAFCARSPTAATPRSSRAAPCSARSASTLADRPEASGACSSRRGRRPRSIWAPARPS